MSGPQGALTLLYSLIIFVLYTAYCSYVHAQHTLLRSEQHSEEKCDTSAVKPLYTGPLYTGFRLYRSNFQRANRKSALQMVLYVPVSRYTGRFLLCIW